MRLTRLIIGFLVVLVAVLIIAGEQLSGASADAVVNARMATVRAPIAGAIEMEQRSLGSPVADGEMLARMQRPRVEAQWLVVNERWLTLACHVHRSTRQGAGLSRR